MHGLFSRSRTTTSPLKSQRPNTEHSDEFGRVSSRNPATVAVAASRGKSGTAPAKKDRNVPERTSAAKGRAPGPLLNDEQPVIPDGSFFPLNLEPPSGDPATSSSDSVSGCGGHRGREQDYGYLSYHHHIVLGLEEVDRLVHTVTSELGTRGLTTPFLFSSLTFDVNSSGVRRLIQAFLRTCVSFPAPDAERTWREEARFAAPAELAMCLRWGLARVLRVSGGNAVRGFISWDMYVEWSEAEVVLDYPTTHFEALVAPLQQSLQSIIINVLSLLARLTAHSSSSGHTPPTLSPLFGPLLFGLGPATLPFHYTYLKYLRATDAMEHVLLAFVRWQDAPSNESGSFGGGLGIAASLGVPTRLKDWIRGYPAMLPEPSTRSRNHERLQTRRGARTVRAVSVRRNVRMYTPDLVKSAASWATRAPSGVTHPPDSFVQSRDWERVAPPTLKLPPRYADSFKKRMDLPPNFHPDTGVASSNASIASTTVPTLGESPTDYFGLSKPAIAGEERFRNLTDLKWGEFEAMGFGGSESSEKKLQFDLTESARSSRAPNPPSLSWTDFSSSGFTRTDAPLSATLQFSAPLVNPISSSPEQQIDITRKLKKTQKSLPPFGWDTEPVMGAEVIIGEAFIDVFCDLVYGGGWMDIEQEEFDRECNWALIEFKSLPLTRSTISAGVDPRTSSTVFLFEEFVPLEYRQQLSAGVQNRRTLASFFSPGKTKQWKQAPTLNGRPYVLGHVPKSLNSVQPGVGYSAPPSGPTIHPVARTNVLFEASSFSGGHPDTAGDRNGRGEGRITSTTDVLDGLSLEPNALNERDLSPSTPRALRRPELLPINISAAPAAQTVTTTPTEESECLNTYSQAPGPKLRGKQSNYQRIHQDESTARMPDYNLSHPEDDVDAGNDKENDNFSEVVDSDTESDNGPRSPKSISKYSVSTWSIFSGGSRTPTSSGRGL